jgi:hypothetical protein
MNVPFISLILNWQKGEVLNFSRGQSVWSISNNYKQDELNTLAELIEEHGLVQEESDATWNRRPLE